MPARVSLVVFLLLVAAGLSGCATPTPQPGENEVHAEGMDREKIRAVIREHIVPIRHCYEKELQTSPKLEGKLILEWEIGDVGKVTSVTVIKPVQVRLDDCVSAVIKASLFETPPRGQVARVRYPFVFHADPAKAVK